MRDLSDKKRFLHQFTGRQHALEFLHASCAKHDIANRISELDKKFEKFNHIDLIVKGEIAPDLTITQIKNLTRQQDKWAKSITDNEIFATTFPNSGFVALAEIDNIVCPQLEIDLGYVNSLITGANFNKGIFSKKIFDFILDPTNKNLEYNHLEQYSPNGTIHSFSSKSRDLRFLGSFLKDISEDDIKYLRNGGNAIAAMISFVGYGSSTTNGFLYNNKLYLNNGYHRVFALKKMGFSFAPVFIQESVQPQLDFPAVIAGLQREQILSMQNPPTFKHFFDNDFYIDFEGVKQMKLVSLFAGLSQQMVPTS